MNFELTGKRALVMSAGGGLGAAIATALAAEGAIVAISDQNERALSNTHEKIVGLGGKAEAFLADLQDLRSVKTMTEEVMSTLGGVDILVNNSGGPPPSTAANVTPENWRAQFDAMVLSLMYLTDQVLPGMRQRKWGRVITSASSGVVAPIPNLGMSNTLRMALLGWSKTLASEVARDGVTVNVVLPGRIATDRIKALDEARATREGKSFDQVVFESTNTIPVGRYGRPEEYGDVVAFLASTRASFLTGSVIRVDGGMIASV
jgi:3-oxoacyl-[acyl-carrier protein] reductase